MVARSTRKEALTVSEADIRIIEEKGRVCLHIRFHGAQVLFRKEDDLPEGWDARPYGPASQEIGDAWVRSQASLVLRVPSIFVPASITT